MEIYAKIGTLPQRRIRVGWKRKPLEIGEVIKFKSVPIVHGEKWKTAIVHEIKELGHTLHYLSLW